MPFISSVDKAEEAVRRIDLTAKVEGLRPVIFATFAQPELREIVRRSNGLFVDFVDAFIGPLEDEFDMRSSHRTGRSHGMASNEAYQRRIDAMNYALSTDDGVGVRNYDRADLVLVGVSRSGKTPTCIYMALHYGIFAANYPLTEETFEAGDLPVSLKKYRDKLFGLSIDAAHLLRIRRERRPDSRYASSQQVNFELREALSLFRRHGIPHMETTNISIEEIASTIMDRMGMERRDAVR